MIGEEKGRRFHKLPKFGSRRGDDEVTIADFSRGLVGGSRCRISSNLASMLINLAMMRNPSCVSLASEGIDFFFMPVAEAESLSRAFSVCDTSRQTESFQPACARSNIPNNTLPSPRHHRMRAPGQLAMSRLTSDARQRRSRVSRV